MEGEDLPRRRHLRQARPADARRADQPPLDRRCTLAHARAHHQPRLERADRRRRLARPRLPRRRRHRRPSPFRSRTPADPVARQLRNVGQAAGAAAKDLREGDRTARRAGHQAQDVRQPRLQVRRLRCLAPEDEGAAGREARGGAGGARGRGCGAAGGPRAAALAPGGGGDLRPPGAAAWGRIRILGLGRAALLGRRTRGRRDFADRAARRERQRKDYARQAAAWRPRPDGGRGGARGRRPRRPSQPAPRRPDRPHALAAPVPDGALPGRRLVRARAGAPLAPRHVRCAREAAGRALLGAERRAALARRPRRRLVHAAAHHRPRRADEQPRPRVGRGAGRLPRQLRGRGRARVARPVLCGPRRQGGVARRQGVRPPPSLL
mmetsp:Transcript_21131/g.66140  ORF Transcript_21131/g.66140 Transcript_21131/m.66140 type:complete len:380 (-) Transcript_21131:245-1384(-)